MTLPASSSPPELAHWLDSLRPLPKPDRASAVSGALRSPELLAFWAAEDDSSIDAWVVDAGPVLTQKLAGTIAAAGGDPSRAIMAGDHANDVLAACGLGVPGIFAAWGYGGPEIGGQAAAVAQHLS